MNGYAEMREALVWVQLENPAEVLMRYWPIDNPDAVFDTEMVVTEKSTAFVAQLIADNVEPGTTYAYEIWGDGVNLTTGRKLEFDTQPLWQWRNDPPAFTLATGSCAYANEAAYDRPSSPYGGDYEIFESIAKDNPDLMLWLGDNTYLREADWFSRTGILKRYTYDRSIPELQNLLSACHHYAIWDDHDYGPNDANRTYPHKDKTLEAFKLFWGSDNYQMPGMPGVTGAFQYADMHFYLLDNRWNRTDYNLATVDEQVLGEDQIDWLIESLKYSRAPFKLVAVGGQVLSTAKVYENMANYEEEREELISRIVEEKIEGVIFLTGDRHHTELSKYEKDGITIYDLTASPFTSSSHKVHDDGNENMMEGTLVHERNYALLHFSGPRTDRKLTIEIKDVDGQTIWTKSIE